MFATDTPDSKWVGCKDEFPPIVMEFHPFDGIVRNGWGILGNERDWTLYRQPENSLLEALLHFLWAWPLQALLEISTLNNPPGSQAKVRPNPLVPFVCSCCFDIPNNLSATKNWRSRKGEVFGTESSVIRYVPPCLSLQIFFSILQSDLLVRGMEYRTDYQRLLEELLTDDLGQNTQRFCTIVLLHPPKYLLSFHHILISETLVLQLRRVPETARLCLFWTSWTVG